MRRAVILCGTASFVMAFLGGVLAFSLVVPTMVEAQQNRLRAESVTVTGSDGADRVEMGTGPGLKSQVNVLDADGKVRAEMYTGGTNGTDPSSAAIRLPGVARLGTGSPGSAALDMDDPAGTSRISLHVATDGTPSMVVRDAHEVDRVRLSQGPADGAAISVLGVDGSTPRVNLATGGPSGAVPDAAGLNVYAADGTQIARLGTSGPRPGVFEPGSALVLFDEQGSPRIVERVAPDGTPAIFFLDANGTVTWSAP